MVSKAGVDQLRNFSATWAGGAEPAILTNPNLFNDPPNGMSSPQLVPLSPSLSTASAESATSQRRAESPRPDLSQKDYESVTLMKLRQAEERKKLIEQLSAEEEGKGKD